MSSRLRAVCLIGMLTSSLAVAEDKPAPPFTDAQLIGHTYYISGHVGIDAATQSAASNVDTETHLVLDSIKKSLADGGLTMDDLVSVTVYCTDLKLYDGFNAIYRTYFHGKFPTRAFIGVKELVRGARFEVSAIAVTREARTNAR